MAEADSMISAAQDTEAGQAQTPEGEAGAQGAVEQTGQAQAGNAEAKPKGAEGEGKEGGQGDKPQGAPDAYEAFTVPEGMTLDQAVVDEAAPVFKDLNLSQEQAQKLVDLYAKHQAAATERLTQQWTEVVEGWAQELRADPEVGGAKLEKETPATMGRAISAIFKGDPEGEAKFREAMNIASIGNHPAFIRAFYRVGKMIGDDKVIISGNSEMRPKNRADVLYPEQSR